jgi:peptide deformylase
LVVHEVLLVGNPQLRETSEYVTDFGSDLQPVLEDLRDTLTNHQEITGSGRGIAAPQIGYLKRVVRIQSPVFTSFLVNPEIVEKSDELFDVWDGCLSLKSALFVNIKRHRRIRVDYQDENGENQSREFVDGMSELLQHELDHLDGVVCTDHLEDNTNITMREEWEKRYRTPGIGM